MAVLATLILAIVVMGVILVPLRQLAGWAKREQLRRSASERILEARFDAYQRLGELPVLAAPHLVRATGVAADNQLRFGIELLASALGTADGNESIKPSWRAIARGALRDCDWSRVNSEVLSGPGAMVSCTGGQLKVNEPHVIIAANVLERGGFVVAAERSTSIVLLGGMEVGGELRIDARDAAVELIVVGDVIVERIQAEAKSLLIHSVFGTIRVGKVNPNPSSCLPAILLEAEYGVVAGVEEGTRVGCPLTRNFDLWPRLELTGERLNGSE